MYSEPINAERAVLHGFFLKTIFEVDDIERQPVEEKEKWLGRAISSLIESMEGLDKSQAFSSIVRTEMYLHFAVFLLRSSLKYEVYNADRAIVHQMSNYYLAKGKQLLSNQDHAPPFNPDHFTVLNIELALAESLNEASHSIDEYMKQLRNYIEQNFHKSIKDQSQSFYYYLFLAGYAAIFPKMISNKKRSNQLVENFVENNIKNVNKAWQKFIPKLSDYSQAVNKCLNDVPINVSIIARALNEFSDLVHIFHIPQYTSKYQATYMSGNSTVHNIMMIHELLKNAVDIFIVTEEAYRLAYDYRPDLIEFIDCYKPFVDRIALHLIEYKKISAEVSEEFNNVKNTHKKKSNQSKKNKKKTKCQPSTKNSAVTPKSHVNTKFIKNEPAPAAIQAVTSINSTSIGLIEAAKFYLVNDYANAIRLTEKEILKAKNTFIKIKALFTQCEYYLDWKKKKGDDNADQSHLMLKANQALKNGIYLFEAELNTNQHDLICIQQLREIYDSIGIFSATHLEVKPLLAAFQHKMEAVLVRGLTTDQYDLETLLMTFSRVLSSLNEINGHVPDDKMLLVMGGVVVAIISAYYAHQLNDDEAYTRLQEAFSDCDLVTNASLNALKEKISDDAQIFSKRFPTLRWTDRKTNIQHDVCLLKTNQPLSHEERLAKTQVVSLGDKGMLYPVVGSSVLDDALMRDFKACAVYYDVKNPRLIDFFGGIQDIKNKQLSTISEPNKSFQEDPIRMMRAIRLSEKLGFTIEKETKLALIANLNLLKEKRLHLFPRILLELKKCIQSKNFEKIFRQLSDLNMLNIIFSHDLTSDSIEFNASALQFLHGYFTKESFNEKSANIMLMLSFMWPRLSQRKTYDDLMNYVSNINEFIKYDVDLSRLKIGLSIERLLTAAFFPKKLPVKFTVDEQEIVTQLKIWRPNQFSYADSLFKKTNKKMVNEDLKGEFSSKLNLSV